MPIWTIASVQAQPSLTLERWTISEVPGGDRHFAGRAVENYEGRVSTRIEKFDINAMRGTTASGRVYQLVGRPGSTSDAEYVWNNWCAINDVEAFDDVSASVFAEHSGSAS